MNGLTHTYAYDNLDRLLSDAAAGANGYTQTYSYDILGNMTYKSDVGAYTYNPDPSIQPHAVLTAGTMSFQYDANGNMTQKAVSGGPTYNINWNEDNRPVSINNVAFTYDGNGQRVRKANGVNTTLYFGNVYEIRNGTGFIHLYANGQRIASVSADGSGNIQYYHANHISSSAAITNQNSIPQQNIDYYPYGSYQPGTPTTPAGGFPGVHYTFTGQEWDDETGLYNYGARLYDPLLGRFISPDTIISKPRKLQAFNRYSYVLNNPLKYIDPSGHQDEGGGDEGGGGEDGVGWGAGDESYFCYQGCEISSDGTVSVGTGNNSSGSTQTILITNLPESSLDPWSNYDRVWVTKSAIEMSEAEVSPGQVTELPEPLADNPASNRTGTNTDMMPSVNPNSPSTDVANNPVENPRRLSMGAQVHLETINPITSKGGGIWGLNLQDAQWYYYSGRGNGLDVLGGIESV